MADNTAIEIDIAPVTGTRVRLGQDQDGNGLWYTAYKPKSFQALELSRIGRRLKENKEDPDKAREVVSEYLRMVFGEEDAVALMARIDDPRDGLDIGPLQDVTQRLFGDEESENPTTSSSGTARPPGRTSKTSKGTRSRTASKSAS